MNSVIHTLFPPRNTLFPYTTLFRSLEQRQVAKLVVVYQPTESKTPVENRPSREAGLLQEPAPGNRRVTRPERLADRPRAAKRGLQRMSPDRVRADRADIPLIVVEVGAEPLQSLQ